MSKVFLLPKPIVLFMVPELQKGHCWLSMSHSNSLTQISKAQTLEELKQLTEPLTDYLATAGCLRPLTSFVDKDKLLEDVLMFQVVQRVHGPLDR